jgi:RHS repeat-associated protein
MVDYSSINDVVSDDICTITTTANGPGGIIPLGAFLIGNNLYSFNAGDSVNGTVTGSGGAGCASSQNEPIGWGVAYLTGGIPTFYPLPSSASVSGNLLFSAPPSDQGFNIPANWAVTYNFSPVPDATCKPCKKRFEALNGSHPLKGSNLDLQNQALGEDIPLTGTPFYLHYQSDRAFGTAGADVTAIMDARSLGGWTLNVHHAMENLLLLWCVGGECTPYATVPKALFLGDGDTRMDAEVQAPVSLNGNLYFTSEDGGEVYVFANGLHVQTVRPMTGAILYAFGYDANNRLISITDASGNVTTIQRDANENATAIVSPFAQTTKLSVDSNGNLAEVTDPAGNSTKYGYAAGGLLTSLTDPLKNAYIFQYDPYGRLTSHADPAGGSTALSRADTGSGHTVTSTTAVGVKSSYEMAFSSTPSVSTTLQYTNTWPNGLQATESKTQLSGQLTESTALPDGTSSSDTMGPDPRWGIQVPIDTSSTTTLGNLTESITATRTASLGVAGNPFSLISQTDTETVNGRKYSSVFTASSRTYVDTTPVGRKTTTTLDALERVSSTQLGALLPINYAYDSQGRLSTLIQGTRTTTLAYDSNGFLASITDPLNLKTSFGYDADGRLLATTLPDGRVIAHSYDSNGNLTSMTPPGESAHSFAYTTVNLTSAYTPPVVAGTGATAYAYDADLNLTTITRPDGQTIKNNYDSAGRVSSVVTPTETANYAYDATTGNLDSATIPGGEAIAYGYNGPLPVSSTWTGTVAGSVSDAYNNNFWVTSESINGGSTVNFTYDKDGLVTNAGSLIVKRDPKDGLVKGATLGSVTDTRTYDTFGELTGFTGKYKTTVLDSVKLTRDADGRISGKTETIGGKKNTYVYKYDAAGRLTSVNQNGSQTSYTYDGNSNRLTQTKGTVTVSGVYDAQDRLVGYGAASFTYTANGELAGETIGAQTTSFQYDVLDNLLSVTLASDTKITYVIDPENHRVGKKVNGTLTQGFLYDGDSVVAQLNGGNAIVSQFIYASGATAPDYMVTGGVTYRIFTDHLGSPRLVVNTSTGQVAEEIDYDEFGNVVNDTNPGFQPFGFAGGLYDQDTKLVRFGARDYNPSIGRWTAKDPILFGGGDANLYGYVLNDPANLEDPTGLDAKDCFCKQRVDKTRLRDRAKLQQPLPLEPFVGEHERALQKETAVLDSVPGVERGRQVAEWITGEDVSSNKIDRREKSREICRGIVKEKAQDIAIETVTESESIASIVGILLAF